MGQWYNIPSRRNISAELHAVVLHKTFVFKHDIQSVLSAFAFVLARSCKPNKTLIIVIIMLSYTHIFSINASLVLSSLFYIVNMGALQHDVINNRRHIRGRFLPACLTGNSTIDLNPGRTPITKTCSQAHRNAIS